MVEQDDSIDEIHTVFAGKLRRYHGESWIRRLIDIKTILLNIRDILYISLGFFQSLLLVRRLKPDAVFLKGGYVVVPIGFASAMLNVPYMTHDSDALPGLANRLVAPWAVLHATALPEEFYMYPKSITKHVGVLVGEGFQEITPQLQNTYKTELGVPQDSRLLLVTGGSLGAKRLNEPISDIADKLLKDYQDLYIVHQVGKSGEHLYDNFESNRLVSARLLTDMHRYTGAADLIVARGGANTLGELAVQGKAVIVVPNKQLTGGHQLKNAKRLEEKHAVAVVNEKNRKSDAHDLDKTIRELLKDSDKRVRLSGNLRKAYPDNAARKVAVLLLEMKGKSRRKIKSSNKAKSKHR